LRALITGITGFAGSHLAEYLLATGDFEVYGTYRWRSRMENIQHLTEVKLVECDIVDQSAVRRTLLQVKPRVIFHLAAESFVPTSWVAPLKTFQTNVLGQVNILQAIVELGLDTRLQIAGSSEEYGKVYPDEVPIKEENPLRPLSPYGVSKVAQDLLGYQYHQSYGLFIVRTRAFNHTGPRRGHVFAESSFAKQIAEIEAGLAEPVISVGNLEARRDLTDVRDTVRGYVMAVLHGEPGEVYNICSGNSFKISEVLHMLLAQSKRKDIRIWQDPSRIRQSDVMVLCGDCIKFRKATGWKPEISIERSLLDLLNYWRGLYGLNA